MAVLKYICLSDLHFGAPSALLTDSPEMNGYPAWDAAPLRNAFCRALVATLHAYNKIAGVADDPPTDVVLLGDIFDLSLGTPKLSIDAFEAFLGTLGDAGGREALGRFVFLPGNHDHELWTVSRYQHMVSDRAQDDSYRHTTPAFVDPADLPPAAMIDPVLRRNNFSGATTFYPNMGLASDDGKRIVMLHHGHFVEAMYRAMSTLLKDLEEASEIDESAEALERINGSWIDFLWSTDGDDGDLGVTVRRMQRSLLTGTSDMRMTHRLAGILASKMTDSLPIPHTSEARRKVTAAARALVDATLGKMSQSERFSFFDTLSADNVAGLKTYLGKTVLQQIREEWHRPEMPFISFVFGHTHKPFETYVPVPELGQGVATYNTGGWDVDLPIFGTKLGAAMVLMDDALNLASIRLCDVPKGGDPRKVDWATEGVRVQTAAGDARDNPLAQTLEKALSYKDAEIDVDALWKAFHAEAMNAYRVKQGFIMASNDTFQDTTAKTGAA